MAEMETKGASGSSGERQTATLPPLPSDAIAIIPVRDITLFPGVVMPVTVGRERSIAAAQHAVREQRQIGLLMQRDREVADPLPVDLHRMGTVANVMRYVTAPDGSHHLVAQGDERFQALEFLSGWPFLVARVQRISDQEPKTPEMEARFLNLQRQTLEALELLPQVPAELTTAVQSLRSAGSLADFATAYMDLKPDEKQEILETTDVSARMDKVSRLLAHRIEVLRLSQEIGRQTKAALDERQREVLLREQMAAIQRQLGEGEQGKAQEMAELGQAIAKAGMPKEVEDQAKKQLRRLERMPEAAAEHGSCAPTSTGSSICRGRCRRRTTSTSRRLGKVLDEDHYGLEKVKKRILEYLAVRKLAEEQEGADPLLHRSARRRQDVARAIDRARDGRASSSASRSAACTTRRRSAATGAPTSARCPGKSSRG